MKIGNLIALNALATANPVAQPNPMMNMLLMEKMMGDDSDMSSMLPMLMMSPGLFGKPLYNFLPSSRSYFNRNELIQAVLYSASSDLKKM